MFTFFICEMGFDIVFLVHCAILVSFLSYCLFLDKCGEWTEKYSLSVGFHYMDAIINNNSIYLL